MLLDVFNNWDRPEDDLYYDTFTYFNIYKNIQKQLWQITIKINMGLD